MEKNNFKATIDSGKNYWCTWASQGYVGKNKMFGKETSRRFFDGNNGGRDVIDEEHVFGEGGFADQFPDLRGDLFFVFDDGWDVPYDAPTSPDISAFGSVIPNAERFPSFPGTPAERLKGLNDKLIEKGWKGLGLWISPTLTGEDFHKDFSTHRELHEEYWKERALWCKYAGVHFWKVDWGAHGNAGLEGIVPYRKMMSDVAKKCFPELIIEHSTCTAPVNGVFGDESKFRYADMDGFKDRGRELCEFSDVFRTYDVTDDMLCDTTTLDRVSYFLPFSKCVVNCEDTLYIGAALGCSVGIMRSSYGKNWMKVNSKLDEVTATVKWQRFAPSFVGGEFNMSDDILVDSMYFGPYDSWAKEAKNRVVDQAAAAVMARNTELPTVVREDKMPFVIASMNPTGVYSVAAIKRRQFIDDTTPPTVSCNVGNAERIGVFGDFKQIDFKFENAPVKMFVQNIIRGEESALDINNYLNGSVVTVSCELLDKFNTVCDISDNAVMFRFEF